MRFLRNAKLIDWLLILSSVITAMKLVDVSHFVWQKRIVPSIGSGWWWLSLILVIHLVVLALLLNNRGKENYGDEPGFLNLFSYLPRTFFYILLGVIPLVYPVLRLFAGSYYFSEPILRMYVFFHATLFFFLVMSKLYRNESPGNLFIISLLINGVVFRILAFLPDISNYPFSLGWSEGSRFYYSSLVFSRSVIGESLPLSPWHPSRYLMLSVPYIIPGLPIWVHRFWQVFLWIAMGGLTGYVLSLKFNNVSRPFKLSFIIWTLLYLLQGPVYYHLLVMVIIILIGFKPSDFWRSLITIVLASMWAGISRVNWIPVPVMLCISIYLILESEDKYASIWHYFVKPIIWTVTGLVSAFLAQYAYILISNNDASKFGSSFTSSLLWDRLVPSATYKPGIFPAIIFVSGPLLFILYKYFRTKMLSWHLLKKTALLLMLLVLFIGGLIVSTKIGGGSNLHNMDAFLVLLLIIVIYCSLGFYHQGKSKQPFGEVILIILVLIPVFISIDITGSSYSDFLRKPDGDAAVEYLNDLLEKSSERDGEILFISQRHIFVFQDWDSYNFVQDYEQIEIMEMAMADNESYLDRFYADLRENRFDYIISDPLSIRYKTKDSAFSEENNIYVEKISIPLLNHYELKNYIKAVKIGIYAPKK